jgi:hypothetical protein
MDRNHFDIIEAKSKETFDFQRTSASIMAPKKGKNAKGKKGAGSDDDAHW